MASVDEAQVGCTRSGSSFFGVLSRLLSILTHGGGPDRFCSEDPRFRLEFFFPPLFFLRLFLSAPGPAANFKLQNSKFYSASGWQQQSLNIQAPNAVPGPSPPTSPSPQLPAASPPSDAVPASAAKGVSIQAMSVNKIGTMLRECQLLQNNAGHDLTGTRGGGEEVVEWLLADGPAQAPDTAGPGSKCKSASLKPKIKLGSRDTLLPVPYHSSDCIARLRVSTWPLAMLWGLQRSRGI